MEDGRPRPSPPARGPRAYVGHLELCPPGTSATCLARRLFLITNRSRAAGWALDPIAQLTNVDLELGDGAAQSVAVHAQLARGAALVAFVLLQNRQNEFLFEFAHRFGIKNITPVHLHNKCFELISHGISLSARRIAGLKSSAINPADFYFAGT